MSAEDRLREILHSEATHVVPAGDGLSRIQERVARRRHRRLLLLPTGALAVAGAVVAVLALGGTAGTQKLVQNPATPGPSVTNSGVANPTQYPRPSSSPVAYSGPAIWPFTSSAQGETWRTNHGARPWADDPGLVTQHFVVDFLGLTGVTVAGTGSTRRLCAGNSDLGQVDLVQISDGGPWTVVRVGGTDLTITAPTPQQAITSPTSVSGRVLGVDENVRLQLIGSGSAHELAVTSAPAGSAVPWQGTLTWSDQSWYTAGLVATTRSLKDGSLTRITVIAVKRGR